MWRELELIDLETGHLLRRRGHPFKQRAQRVILHGVFEESLHAVCAGALRVGLIAVGEEFVRVLDADAGGGLRDAAANGVEFISGGRSAGGGCVSELLERRDFRHHVLGESVLEIQ